MSAAELRRRIKSAVDRFPSKHLQSLADYVQFLDRPTLARRISDADRAFALGKGIRWRKINSRSSSEDRGLSRILRQAIARDSDEPSIPFSQVKRQLAAHRRSSTKRKA
jgi:hypothetical protein